MSEFKEGDHVFVLSGLDVEERRVYEDDAGALWMKADGRCGVKVGGYLSPKPYATLDEAVAASKAAREREIRTMLRRAERLALNTNVKVRLLKHPKRHT